MAEHGTDHDHGHKHGTMDVSDQERVFNGFVRFVANSIVLIVLLLLFLYAVNG